MESVISPGSWLLAPGCGLARSCQLRLGNANVECEMCFLQTTVYPRKNASRTCGRYRLAVSGAGSARSPACRRRGCPGLPEGLADHRDRVIGGVGLLDLAGLRADGDPARIHADRDGLCDGRRPGP